MKNSKEFRWKQDSSPGRTSIEWSGCMIGATKFSNKRPMKSISPDKNKQTLEIKTSDTSSKRK
jgi:hypothetical protein